MDASIFGAKIVLYNENAIYPEVVTMIPTLSSLYLSYYEQSSFNYQEEKKFMKNETVKKQQRVFDFHEDRPNYMREPLSI